VIKGYDAVVVYGGDGTVTEVSQALFQKAVPMIVLPGGTANVIAKELKMPLDTVAALELVKLRSLMPKKIDMGKCNGVPFLLRINIGFVADMTSNPDPNLKATLGQLAYGVAAVHYLMQSQMQHYTLDLDGYKTEVDGVACIIANVGNIGLSDVSIVPESDVSDGKLDVLIMHNSDLSTFVKAAGSALLQQKATDDVYTHWQVEQVLINIPPGQSVQCDDQEEQFSQISAEIVPQALNVLVPQEA
jgi:diacylglycerol kinase (ATP)